MTIPRTTCPVALALALPLALAWGCSAPEPAPPPADPQLPERHQRWSDDLGQGGTPDPARYADLAAEGYAALLCVDGQAPDAAAAEAAGLTLYHVPIGYGAMSDYQRLAILRAARAAPGPLYVYCQHGKHRGPAAAALVRLDRGVAKSEVLEGFLETVNAHYAGLIAGVREFERPSDAEVESVGVPPAGVANKPLGMAMDDVDEHYAALQETPSAELAALLRQDFKETTRLTEGELAADLAAAGAEAGAIEALLDRGPPDEALLDRIAAFAERCVHCHGLRR